MPADMCACGHGVAGHRASYAYGRWQTTSCAVAGCACRQYRYAPPPPAVAAEPPGPRAPEPPPPAAADPGHLLTPAEVAALFGVSPKTVAAWGRSGRLSFVRTLGGHRRFRGSEVRAQLEGER